MANSLCSRCGAKMEDTMRTCPVCGALNPHNREVKDDAVRQVNEHVRAARSFSAALMIPAIVIGIILTAVHLWLLVEGDLSFLNWELFVGAVTGALAAVLGLIGLGRKEPVGKAVFITCGISVWMLLMYLFIAL